MMMACKIILLISIFAFANTVPLAEEDLPILGVVGGANANIKFFPYQVALEYEPQYHFCAGSIISKSIVLSAAHCTVHTKPGDFTVRVGSSKRGKGGKVVKVKEIINHPGYQPGVYDSDISILILEEPLEFSDKVKAIKLPTSELPFKERAIVTGWGSIREDGPPAETLQYADAIIFTEGKCRQLYPHALTPNMFCAGHLGGGRDACQGDSGGPLQYKGTLIGIVSWGYGCAQINRPGFYTYVYRMLDWVRSHVDV